MAFQTGTATNYEDLLTKLVQFCTGEHAVSATISAGGTGYTLGDILTVSGGTSSFTATFEVTGESAGVVTAVKVRNGGSYTSTPSNPASTTGGTGSGCTLTITYDDTGWMAVRDLTQLGLTVVEINAGGTGYTVNDILTVSGGTGTAATLRVTSVNSGAVDGIAIETVGEYTVAPSNPVSVTGGTGSSATFNLTIHGTVGGKEVILEGEGDGSDEVYVGIRSYFRAGPDVRNWELAGFSGFNAGLAYASQPGVSPGRHEASTGGAYVPLANSSINFWFNATGRRIIGVAKAGTTYSSFYMGLLNPFATANEYPLPLIVLGSSDNRDERFTSSLMSFSGITDPVSTGGTVVTGPGLVRLPNGAWQTIRNSTGVSSARAAVQNTVIYPSGTPWDVATPNIDADDIVVGTTIQWSNVIPVTGQPGTPTFRFLPTPNSGGDLTILVPATAIQSMSTGQQILGELDQVYWISTAQGALSEDVIVSNNKTYRVFQCGARTEFFTYFAIEQGDV